MAFPYNQTALLTFLALAGGGYCQGDLFVTGIGTRFELDRRDRWGANFVCYR